MEDQLQKPNQSTLNLSDNLSTLFSHLSFNFKSKMLRCTKIIALPCKTNEKTNKKQSDELVFSAGQILASYLEPSWYFLSNEVLREMADWAYWNICWLGEGRSGPWVGETRESGSAWGTWVIRCQPGPVPSVLYSIMGTRYISEAPLRDTEQTRHKSI